MKTISKKLQKRLSAASAKLEIVVTALEASTEGPYLSRGEAYELYGKEQVKTWLQQQLVKMEHPGKPGPIRMHKLWLDSLPVLAEMESCLQAILAELEPKPKKVKL
ncbi:hypothetical protein [Mucilaginibacter lacusdianchii]|uniref:hypothetical protein n=1 Tax=Mucilaginibacter lacusdianchii TaxID=2684211 RepID=UPI00131D1807|nr:hypothetical protein [Mucilaginibacter sp. JXJ CY 39]